MRVRTEERQNKTQQQQVQHKKVADRNNGTVKLWKISYFEKNLMGELQVRKLDTFMVEEHLSWEKCVYVCTDGAAVMTGHRSGVVTRIKAKNPKIAATHCMLHRQALASKSMAPYLADVLEVVVAAVKFIKSRPLKSCLHAKLCTEMGAAHDQLLFHSEVRCRSRGKVLERLFELRRELH